MRVNIKVKDVNDNPPDFANNNEVLMCETVMPGKVRLSVFEFVRTCIIYFIRTPIY